MLNFNTIAKMLSAIAFLIMVATNALANLVPLNGVTAGELSRTYPTLITPSAITFLIWAVIYALLMIYTVYQLGTKKSKRKLSLYMANYIRGLYIVSCLCNVAWIFAWHFRYIALSLVLMIALFVCLLLNNKLLYTEELTSKEKLFIRLPFSVYFGWITVATAVNTAVLLISIRWSGYGISDYVWAMIGILIIFLVASYITLKYSSLAYAITVIWALIGLIIRHVSKDELSGKYPKVILSLILCIILMLVETGFCLYRKKKNTSI